MPRLHTRPIYELGLRALKLLERIAPMVEEQYRHLVSCGIDVRRLTLNGDDAEVAALLLDELGVQYHEIGATDYERIREALTKMEEWVRKREAASDERKRGAADALPEEDQAAPSAAPRAGDSEHVESPPPSEAEPVDPEAAPVCPDVTDTASHAERPPAPYSSGGASLDWTKL